MSFGAATPQKLVYERTVHVDLSNNEINLADSASYGHRVVVEVPRAQLDGVTSWTRSVGSLYPVGILSQPGFTNLLLTQLGTSYVDMDGQANGLNFSSVALDDVVDSRLRKVPGTNSVNDFVMAYVLFKVYGKSSFSTINEVFNIEDVQNMLENVTVTAAVASSLASNTTSVNKLFKDLLTTDPKRYFDASGHQVEGLFETNPADEPNSGSWLITEGDVLEIRLEFEFAEAITRRSVADSQLAGAEAAYTIAAGEKFYIRLQLTAV
jgi:hypothetical protein